MKLWVTLLILLCAGGDARAFSLEELQDFKLPEMAPTPALPAKLRELIFSQLDRDQRIFLHAHLPALFPVRRVCRAERGEKKQSLLPWESLEAGREGVRIVCPDALEVKVSPDSKLKWEERADTPEIMVDSGFAEVRSVAPFTLSSPAFSLSLQPQLGASEVVVEAKDSGFFLLCLSGMAEAEFLPLRRDGDTKSRVIAMQNCRWDLSVPDEKLRRNLQNGQTIYTADLNLAPEMAQSIFSANVYYDFLHRHKISRSPYSLLPTPAPKGFVLEINPPRIPAQCKLYYQRSLAEPPKLAHEKTITVGKDYLRLHADYRNYYLHTVCLSTQQDVDVSALLPPNGQQAQNEKPQFPAGNQGRFASVRKATSAF